MVEEMPVEDGNPSASSTVRRRSSVGKARRHSIEIEPNKDADMTMSTVQNGEEDDNWFTRGLILKATDGHDTQGKAQALTSHSTAIVKESIEGLAEASEQHDEVDEQDGDRALVFIYDSAAIHFHFDVFIKQMYINTVPFAAKLFTPCITNWQVQSLDYTRLWKTGSFFLIDHQLFVPLSMLTLMILAFVVPNEQYPGGDDLQTLVWFSIAMPQILYIMHRVSIAAKYATLSRTEYARIMNCKSEVNGAIYQSQMQLLSAWNDFRSEEVLLFEMQAAAVRVGLELRQVFFSVENPNNSEEAAYLFMQWQAMLMGLPSIRGLSAVKVHQKLEHVLKPDVDGNYRVFVDDAALGILKWIEAIGVVDTQKGPSNFVEESVDKSLAAINEILGGSTGKKFGSIADSIEKFQTTIIVLMSFIPFFFLDRSASGSATLWLIIVFFLGFQGFHIGIFAFKLNLVLLRDTGRRIYEAHILSEMMRTNDFIHEFKFLNLAKNKSSRESYLENSEIDSLGRSKNQLRLLNAGASVMDVLAMAEEEIDSMAPSGARERVASLRMVDSAKDANSKDSKGSQGTQDAQINSYFAARMPKLSQNVGGRANVIAWSYVRTMFRHSGVRYKLRVDILAAFTFVVFFFLFMASILLNILEGSSPWLAGLNQVYWNSPFAYQVVLGTLITVVSLLANVAEAAKANQDYSTHSELLTKHVMEIEGKFIKLADSAILHNEQTLKELDRLRDLKDSIELTCRTTKIVDEQSPLNILGIPATYALFSTILSIAGTLAVSLIGLYTKRAPGKGGL